LKLALSLVLSAAMIAGNAQASLLWRWSCRGAGIDAAGTLTTRDAADADGFYEITAVTGETNGLAITGLQPTDTSIPGNEGYPVDNLIREGGPQLTKDGFAFSLANGTYVSPFFGAHFATPGYYAYLSDPASARTSESAVAFTAAIVR
jgi:hypothetical protein